VRIHEGEFVGERGILGSYWTASRAGREGGVVVCAEDDQAVAGGARVNARDCGAALEERDVAWWVHVGVDVDDFGRRHDDV